MTAGKAHMSDTRVKRLCDVCGGFDSDPRHVQAVPPGTAGAVPDQRFLSDLPDGLPATAIAELLEPGTLVRHMDCCASNGCAECSDVVATSKGATGKALISHITKD